MLETAAASQNQRRRATTWEDYFFSNGENLFLILDDGVQSALIF